MRRKTAAPAAEETPVVSDDTGAEQVEPEQLEVLESDTTAMIDLDGTVHEIVPAGVAALLVLGWAKV